MASSLSTLKNKLGSESINEDTRMSLKSEINYESFQQSKKPVDSRSELELARERLIKLEEEERDSRMITSPVVEYTNIAPVTPKVVASPKSSYHSIKIPFTDNATSALNNFNSGSINFVHLKVNDTYEKIDCKSEKQIQTNELNAHIAVDEPGFYIFKYQTRNAINPFSNVFIYCCPGKSTPQIRMVYSTSKPTVSAEIEKCGIRLAKKLEVTDTNDVTPEYIDDELFPKVRTPVNSYGFKPKPTAPILKNPHPIYSLMAKGEQQHIPGRKKVVMPPPGAW